MLHFHIQNLDILRYAIFHEILEIGIYIQKEWHFSLRAVIIYKNSDTPQKARQFALRLYIYKNPDTLRYSSFHGIFEIGGGRGGVILKNNALCVKPLYLKKNVWLHLYIYIYALCITFITICFGIVLIPNYKRTYNQSNQIDKNIWDL